MTVLISLQFGYVRFGFGGYYQQLGIFILYSLFDLFYVRISVYCTTFIDIADVKYRLCGEQEKIMRNLLFIFGVFDERRWL